MNTYLNKKKTNYFHEYQANILLSFIIFILLYKIKIN